MRIIAGTHRGKKLFTPIDDRIRPTSDRAREALFSIILSKLGNDLTSLDVLDIFSGTGAFGLESASRGAKSVTFVDIDLTLTQKNAKLCGFNNLRFIKKSALFLPPAPFYYGLIFADAPYNKGLSEPLSGILLKNNYINHQTLLIIETAKDEPLQVPSALQLIDERTYGAARFSFFKLA